MKERAVRDRASQKFKGLRLDVFSSIIPANNETIRAIKNGVVGSL